MKKTITAMTNEVRANLFNDLIANYDNVVQTDTASFDIATTLENGEVRVATVSIVIRKADYDQDDKVAAFNEKVEAAEQRELDRLVRAEKKARKQAEKEVKKAEKEVEVEVEGE